MQAQDAGTGGRWDAGCRREAQCRVRMPVGCGTRVLTGGRRKRRRSPRPRAPARS